MMEFLLDKSINILTLLNYKLKI